MWSKRTQTTHSKPEEMRHKKSVSIIKPQMLIRETVAAPLAHMIISFSRKTIKTSLLT